MSEQHQSYDSQSFYPSGAIAPVNVRNTNNTHHLWVNWPSIHIAKLPMIYQICLLLFCSGVFLVGLAKLLEVFKP